MVTLLWFVILFEVNYDEFGFISKSQFIPCLKLKLMNIKLEKLVLFELMV